MGIFSRKPKGSVTPQAVSAKREPLSPLSARLQLITGKGGVGRTTTALTLAESLALRGRKTLILEVRDAESELTDDPSGSSREDSMLGRALSFRAFSDPETVKYKRNEPWSLSALPCEVSPKLWAAQLVAPVGHSAFLRSIIPSDRLVKAALESKPLSRFLRSAPSMHELGIFYHLKLLEEDQAFDHIVIDLPATGHALALAQLPDKISKIIKRGQIVDSLRAGVQHIADPREAALWVVTLPETLPLTEAVELGEALAKDGIEAAGLICNRGLSRALSEYEDQLLRRFSNSNEPDLVAIARILRDANLDPDERRLIDHFKRELRLPELIDHEERVRFAMEHWPWESSS